MTASIHLHLWACAVIAIIMMFAIGAVHGRTIQLNWTSDGVKDYTSVSTPLRLNLGDTLELTCNNTSNLFIQTDRIQYDNCNASAGSGAFKYNGFCFSGSSLRLTLRENSQDLDNTVNFGNNRVYFLTSYSEGSLRANDATFTSGGQCEDGLKMIFVIGYAPVPPVDGGDGGGGDGDSGGGNQHGGTGPPNNEGLNSKPSETNGMIPIIAGAAAGGVLLLVGLLVMIIIIVICVKRGHCSRDKSSATYGNSSKASYYNESMFNSEPDSQACTLTRTEFSLAPKPVTVIEVEVQETTQPSHDNISFQTFGQKKSASIDYLHDNQHYKSAERGFDDATGQLSTPFRVNPTPEHLLKAQSTSEIFSGKPKPLPRPKPRQNNVYKSSSADDLISR